MGYKSRANYKSGSGLIKINNDPNDESVGKESIKPDGLATFNKGIVAPNKINSPANVNKPEIETGNGIKDILQKLKFNKNKKNSDNKIKIKIK